MADLCHPDFLCRAGHDLSADGPGPGRTLGADPVEMVYRAFYHDSRAVQHGESTHLVSFLAEHAKLLGIVKRQRKSHRERQQLEAIIWGDP